MNDYDRGARRAVKECPIATLGWLCPRKKESLRYRGWLDSQSAPRPGEPDRRCDTIMRLIDDEGAIPPWAFIVELFTEPDGDALDRAMEYVGRYRRETRHGPHGQDKFHFGAALIFLTGTPSQTELKSNMPGMQEVGLWFGPRVVCVAEQDAVAHVEGIEQNRLARGLLCWSPLMRGGQSEEFARRWRVQVERESEINLRNTIVDIALTFAWLTDCRDAWLTALEGLVLKRSGFLEEVRVEIRQQDTLEALEVHFPGAVPPAVVERIKAETDLAKLGKWHKLAVKADMQAIQQDMG